LFLRGHPGKVYQNNDVHLRNKEDEGEGGEERREGRVLLTSAQEEDRREQEREVWGGGGKGECIGGRRIK
jgi:hypothetical protein